MNTTEPEHVESALTERNLTTRHAVAQALAIGPIFSTGVILSSVSVGAGYSTTLSVILSAVGALAIGYVLALYARRYIGAGGIYEYLRRMVHPSVGTTLGWLFLYGYVFLGAGGIFLVIGDFIRNFWVTNISSTSPPWWIWGLLAAIFVCYLAYRGVRIATSFMLGLAVVSVIPLIILAVAIMAKGGFHGTSLTGIPFTAPNGFSPVFSGILLGILLFTGFEAAASIGEECKNPLKSIPRAVIITIAICAGLFILMAYAMSIGYGKAAVDSGAWANSGTSALPGLADTYVGHWLGTYTQLVLITDSLGVALAMIVAFSRMAFALGRDGLMPRSFARTSRHGTPLLGSLLPVIACGAFMIAAVASNFVDQYLGPNNKPIFPTSEFAMFVTAATAGGYAIELIYLALAIVGFWLIYRSQGPAWHYVVALVAAATPVLAFKGALSTPPYNPSNVDWMAFFWVIASLILSVAWVLAVHLRQKRLTGDSVAADREAPAQT